MGFNCIRTNLGFFKLEATSRQSWACNGIASETGLGYFDCVVLQRVEEYYFKILVVYPLP